MTSVENATNLPRRSEIIWPTLIITKPHYRNPLPGLNPIHPNLKLDALYSGHLLCHICMLTIVSSVGRAPYSHFIEVQRWTSIQWSSSGHRSEARCVVDWMQFDVWNAATRRSVAGQSEITIEYTDGRWYGDSDAGISGGKAPEARPGSAREPRGADQRYVSIGFYYGFANVLCHAVSLYFGRTVTYRNIQVLALLFLT